MYSVNVLFRGRSDDIIIEMLIIVTLYDKLYINYLFYFQSLWINLIRTVSFNDIIKVILIVFRDLSYLVVCGPSFKSA